MQEGRITAPVQIQLGNLKCEHPVVLVDLSPQAEHILGADFMNKCNLSFDPVNKCIWQMATSKRAPSTLPVGEYVNRVSTIGEYWFDPLAISSDPTIREVLQRNKGVFAEHKHDCGQIPGEVLIEGPDPKPQKQYGFPDRRRQR